MKDRKKLFVLIFIIILVLVLLIVFLTRNNSNNNFIRLDYNEFKEKVDNKDNFVLCVSRTTCSHCNNYKPKLEKISNKYDIKIYYIEIDKFGNDGVDYFKDKFGFDGSTPTTLFIKNGEETTTANRIEGDVNIDVITQKLKTNGYIA